MHILQLCPRVPYPPTDGGAIAMYDVTAGLSRAGHQVTVLALNTPKHHQPATVLDHLGPLVRLIPVSVDTRLSPVKALRNLLFSELPYNIERFVSPAVVARLQEVLSTETIDVIQVEGGLVSWYVDTVQRLAPGIPVVLRAHNVEYTIWQMLAERETNVLKRFYLSHLAKRLRRFEHRTLPRFDAVAAITEPDQRRLRELGCQEPVVFVPAGVDLNRFQRDPAIRPKPRTLFMIGSLDWLPNQEGVDWLLREVWPRAHELYPELELHIAGKETPPHIRNLNLPGVTIHGFVESAAEFMQRYEVMLVPLLSGGGMRIKIIEGMALGKCIISTGLGSEGIHVRDNFDIVLCDEPSEWIDRLGRYYRGELGQQDIGEEAARTIARLYDNRRVVESFLDLYTILTPQPRAATR
ncbi:glycosyltransferase involved in cell wall biosynthesis [Hymenobacter luteus]|uniref:Glycosyltransferase involved in cell wall biosynthesis n=2 Tax=Hymenobacter TaxID=89966 RepID=A0A7W9WCI2_9BACT|nr:glycosyltransferase family 4 protein [Hymenobacter latericoloratus]MBB4602165.1 glycosyltransferase involved in cell wall biosynthesis [Hymenobacter latericoloratus]MBB6059406.1 glycosyltransferase involved in cell wall biosynthesis [Hymenobacter luteus]